MAFIYATRILIVLLIVAFLAIWFFMFKKKVGRGRGEGLSELDRDLVKTNDNSNVFKETKNVLQTAFFIVSIFTYTLVTYGETIEQEVVKKKVLRTPTEGKEIDIPPTDIPPPPPPKPKVVQVIKPVSDKIDPEIPKDTLPKPLDEDFADDEDLDDEPEDEVVVIKKGPITTSTPDVIPTFKNGGDSGVERNIYANLEPHKESIPAGEYFFLMGYLIDENGRLSQVSIIETDCEDSKLKALMIQALGSLQNWSPGQKDNTVVRSLIEKEFFIIID